MNNMTRITAAMTAAHKKTLTTLMKITEGFSVSFEEPPPFFLSGSKEYVSSSSAAKSTEAVPTGTPL